MSADPLIGATLAGRYRLDAQAGSGGMSTVYRAFDTVLERPVAIKVMHSEFSRDESFLERFRREAKAGAQISHPHVVTVIDAGEDEGHPYIVFDFIEGETLKQRIRRDGPLPITEAIAYAIEIGRALSVAHASGLIHRDIKPQNVLLDREGRARVTDFGIARLTGAEGLTQTGHVVGTTDYISPEQALGRDVSGQSDVYALGVVLFEMLTGETPFTGETQVSVAMKHVRDALPDVQRRRPHVSAALAGIVEKATAKETGNRYATIDAMIADLEEVLTFEVARSGQEDTGEVTTVLRSLPSETLRNRIPSRARSRRRLAVVASVALLVALLAVILLTDNKGGHPNGRASDNSTEIQLPSKAAIDYDPPPGDGLEHTSKLQTVIDGNPQTYWDTEIYRVPDFGNKRGVGLLINAGRPVDATSIAIRTPRALAGFEAQIFGANSPVPKSINGAWTSLAPTQTVASKTRIALSTGGIRYQNYLIWITRLAGDGPYQAGISEVRLLG